MEAGEGTADTVHPEVRAHINSLVSALGGISNDDEESRYKLGDDALDVLRDIKKWIRFYDEKTNRMDVARCLAEANIIGGDLLHILASWPENANDNKFKARLALACYEIMAPLTWPIEKDRDQMTVNHHRHIPVLQLAQLGYKRDIVNFDGAQILHTAVRIALPSLAVPIGDRTPRDQGIIKLVLYFLRNIAMISPPPGLKYDGDESQISRSATIDAFSFQDIFLTILTIASNMGEDFRTEDVIVMDIIFHLVKRVDVHKLFLNEKELTKAKAGELTALMNKEAAMLRSFNRKAPTRHNRFGTMVWVKRPDGKMSTVSGQDALADAARREQKMDSTKTFRPPRRARKDEMEPKDLGTPVSLNARANDQLRGFVEEFLDSGFNPLFLHVRKTIDREAPHLMHYHRRQFFYLVSWFLEAERVRQKNKKGPKSSPDDVGAFNLVAAVLNQEMFVTLIRALHKSFTESDWSELTAVLRCFTQILLTVQDMFESENEEDQEIAENILSRLFYEEATHDAVANIVRNYKDQGFEFLDAVTELLHTYLRILEAYSKQNVDMQVRSRKRTRRKKKADKAAGATNDNRDDGEDDSADDEANAEKTSRERKFDFKRFANRFVPQGVVDSFVKFTTYYRDLDESQLKRAHRYFYRVAFKQDMSVMLFRVDIINLLYNMIKGPEPLDKSSGMYKDWEELVKQIIRKCVKKIEERPALIIEMLFSKINSTAHYLEFGYEKQTISTTHPRPAAELEFRHIVDHDQQIAIAVGALLDKSHSDHIDWIKKQLAAAESERRAWETAEKAMASVEEGEGTKVEKLAEDAPAKESPTFTLRPDNDARRTAIFKNGHLRLLMKLVGFERLAPTVDETPESLWVLPGPVTADQLKESLEFINQAEFSPPVFENDESAEDQLRRKAAPRKRATYDDDDDDDAGDIIDDGDLFPPNLPGPRAADAQAAPKKRARRSRRPRSGEGSDAESQLDEEELAERAAARRRRELEKARKIKSELYVHASDDETDDERDREFFAREEATRKRVQTALLGVPTAALADGAVGKKQKSKRKSEVLLLDSDEESAAESVEQGDSAAKRRKTTMSALLDSDSDGDDDDSFGEDEALSPPKSASAKTRKKTLAGFLDDSSDEDETEPAPSTQNSGDMDVGGKSADDMDTDDTPLSSSPHQAAAAAAEAAEKGGGVVVPDDGMEDDDDEPVSLPVKKRSRVRTGFLMDSSDEE
ncbi:Timeless-domain-containing protein [Pleurostoma richardsiae]|uniref:Topoisomerase 1-associated factor 1 n=1 Tax=Pleurostoma richardsiae TaxID=41990 RepID=A0AA38VD77_9PEZI|nr:Timeless-domain-containing protein [Pleurostoma richardsiae]